MKSNNKFLKFLSGKGFYGLVGVCLIVVGITALAVSNSVPKPPEVTDDESYNTSLEIITEVPSEKPAAKEVSGIKANSSKETSSKSYENEEKIAASFFVLPLTGEILKEYSDNELLYSKTYGDMRLHMGLDIKAKEGTAVKASGDGTVLGIAKDPLYGTIITIDHGNGITGLYCGLKEKVTVKKGQVVKAGDNIGAVGEIPCEASDGAHLHLAFKDNKQYVSPLSLINLGS